MNVILLGPQGSGKGTQAELLAEKLHLTHLEMGKVLRSIADSDNSHAAAVKQALVSGNLVPDEYTRLIAWDFITKHHPTTQGFIFEGYPRSIAQYEHLEDMLRKFGKKIDLVVVLTISEEESIRRLSSRRTCARCGRVYNLITHPPPGPTCECGGKLVHREDDQPEAIKRRLQVYREQTAPVFTRATQQGIGIDINGERPISVIHHDILAALPPEKA